MRAAAFRDELDEERLELPERVEPLPPERAEPLLRDRVEPLLRVDRLEAELRDRPELELPDDLRELELREEPELRDEPELLRPPPLRLRLWDLPDDSAISHSFRALRTSAV